MAKKKNPTKAQAGAGKQTGGALSLFPAKPVRSIKEPGTKVELLTNLFRLSLKAEKPIHRYGIVIEALDAPSKGASTSPEGKNKPAIPRKIPKDIRLAAVKKAVQSWLINNNRAMSECPFCYVLDGNASTMFALFDMPLTEMSQQGKRMLDLKAEIKLPSCTKEKFVEETFKVQFHDGYVLNVRELMDYCSGKGVQDSEYYKDHIRALNVIFLGEIVTVPRFLTIQSSKSGFGTIFEYEKKNQFPLSGGVICNKGFNISVRPTETGLALNVANTVAPFHQPLTLLELLAQRFGVRNLGSNLDSFVREGLARELDKKQVEAIHINYGTKDRPHYRKYRVSGITELSVSKQMFDIEGQKMSVFDYFKREYPKSPLKYQNLPCIIDRNRFIPIEVCRVVDKQRVTRKLTGDETTAVIKQAALKPERHFQHVTENAVQVQNHRNSFENFGLALDIRPIEVTGRELPPITLSGAREQVVRASNGEYQYRGWFVKPTTVSKWAILILVDDIVKRQYKNSEEMKSVGRHFGDMYAKAGYAKGVKIGPVSSVDNVVWDGNESNLRKNLRGYFDHLNNNAFTHCLAVLSTRIPDWTYSFIQYLEATTKGKRKPDEPRTRVSCLKFENYHKKIVNEQADFKRLMFLNNLWLKHNTKLGGVNMVLDPKQTFGIPSQDLTRFLDPGYIFISIDVCHPSPNDRLKQSVAAAVGVWNITNSDMSYCTRMRVQRKDKSDQDRSTVEEVGEVGIMVSDIVASYKDKTRKLPTHVVILRDGVSEGQFKMVLNKELCQIKQALSNSYAREKTADPKLTCLTVQKRHKIRFMRKVPVKTKRGDNDYNIQPGTVVDSEITTPNDFSFYLAPHKAIQGTARAPHTYMIYDEIKFSQDSAQAMIFVLSYLSPRCTKGTSIPTPINLADLAAERGKNLVVSWNEENSTTKMSDDERLVKLNAFLSNLGETNYKNTLFYI